MRREVTQLAQPSDSAHMLLNLAIAGVGIIRFGDIIVVHAIRDGLLMPVLEDWQETESSPLWALHQAGPPTHSAGEGVC
jgi:DNA-binding transcriptional LysR family regulator